MKVSSTDSHAEIIRQFTITEGNPVVGMAYSNPPKLVVVERGAIRYTWQDGKWIVRNEWAVKTVGTVLKKDGTPSKNTHSREGGTAANSWRNPEYVPAQDWKWIEPIIDLLRPNGDLSMMTLTESEVDW